MDFFRQQDIARRNSRLLVVLFLLAVLLLVVLTNVVLAGFLWFRQDYNIYIGSREGWAGFFEFFSWARFGKIGLGITATVALVVLAKWWQLSTGGKVVAETMGGTRILPQTKDRAERRCLNVVAEIALAANMPVPAVYVMNDERGINAFAAGITPADAVVAVTRGTLAQLKRPELQGVVAHEFSHILNGDMRLNIRLAALLKGITFVGDIGHLMLYSGSHHRRSDPDRPSNSGTMMPVLGILLWLLGWLGELAAGFIKAAISRQKEYLADAGAVQFTRDSAGISDALKVIGGYIPGTLVHAARATEMSHIFFGEVEHRLWRVFATHPPLAARIRKLDPTWDGQFIARKVHHYQELPSRPGAAEVGVGRATLVAAALAAIDQAQQTPLGDADFGPEPDLLEAETAARHQLPLAFVQQSHDPLGAQALALGLLTSDDPTVSQRQLKIVNDSQIDGLEELVNTLAPGVLALRPEQRLPLLELCLPALRSLSLPQYRVLKNNLLAFIHADERIELFEWCMFQLIRHYLDPEFVQVSHPRARYRNLRSVEGHLQIVLSVLANTGSDDAAAAFARSTEALDMPSLTLLPAAQCPMEAFTRAVKELSRCYPLLQPRILKAMVVAARADGQLQGSEREIIASVAAVMNCPLPEDNAIWDAGA